MQRKEITPVSKQVKKRVETPVKKKEKYAGNTGVMISTGSTLLDLAISGGRVRGGGIPGGIMVEIFGPASSGKTVFLCEIAGDVQRKGGEIMFRDPEGRLDEQFAQIFDLDTKVMDYERPNTITEVFSAVRDWQPENKKINGIFTDSLAALSTDMEMDEEEGDKMGMRRAKEFSEQLRKTARILAGNNLLLVGSNQTRETVDAGKYAQDHSPGGRAIGFYSSLRLRTSGAFKLKRKKKMRGKIHEEVFAIQVEVEVFKSSIWKPYRKAKVTIDFEYGIDDIRENLKYIKTMTGSTVYILGDRKLDSTIEEAIAIIEEEKLSKPLREEVIDIWEEYQEEFVVERKKKER